MNNETKQNNSDDKMRSTKLVLWLALGFVCDLVHGFKSSSSDAKEINSILVNDLNIIASKIDEIPETSLNVKLVLLAYECNDVKLNWKIGSSEQSKSGAGKFSSVKPKIFGYQVVVREILESAKNAAGNGGSLGKMMVKKDRFSSSYRKESPYAINDRDDSNAEKTLKVYSSKFIDSDQSKFK